MITLQTEFVSGEGGFSSNPLTYRQVKRTNDVAMYARHRAGNVSDFEIFKIKVVPKGTVIFQTTLEDDTEHYPNSSEFGRIAWTSNNLIAALNMFDKLVSGQDTTSSMESAQQLEPTPKPLGKVADLKIPDVPFSTQELAGFNNVQYPVAHTFIKYGLQEGKIKFLRNEHRNAKGKGTNIFGKA